jgi:hypothetical protein
MTGAVTYFFGSIIYFPIFENINNFDANTLGGILFTIGSFFFTLADLL